MKASTKKTQLERLDNGEWLNRLLADIRLEIERQPSPQAVRRIRSRLLNAIRRPAKAAA